ncbi:hypothetical protein Q4F19_00620 [Sphingomonas sp. BIUV-7]|uniref:STAS/SEC14 domain-containing protein n=1 Tax=Sphingomonas natans TaxID=3063330 RepID=A0ABT8Y589_9SPHN|nr:hypothetical protein [Sphingomonas sp. BIUV-7]MDO6412874.1 hypothetical protein [Sphingomonas sp. BIUV-7]
MTVTDAPRLYAIDHDQSSDIIRVSDLAVQSVEEIDRYLGELGREIAAMRARRGTVRLLADLRHSPIRSQAAAERLRRGNLTLYRAGDRVALLVESSLMKMQLRRNLVADYQNIFVSPHAAETWLTALDATASHA